MGKGNVMDSVFNAAFKLIGSDVASEPESDEASDEIAEKPLVAENLVEEGPSERSLRLLSA